MKMQPEHIVASLLGGFFIIGVSVFSLQHKDIKDNTKEIKVTDNMSRNRDTELRQEQTIAQSKANATYSKMLEIQGKIQSDIEWLKKNR